MGTSALQRAVLAIRLSHQVILGLTEASTAGLIKGLQQLKAVYYSEVLITRLFLVAIISAARQVWLVRLVISRFSFIIKAKARASTPAATPSLSDTITHSWPRLVSSWLSPIPAAGRRNGPNFN